jgi:hypothetical protein
VLPMNEFLIYIRKHYVVFSHLGFHVNTGVLFLIDVMLFTSYDYICYIYIYIYIYWMHS